MKDQPSGVKPLPSFDQVSPGLSSTEAEKIRLRVGPNALPEEKVRLWLVFLKKMWAPVPWMLEISIILELVLGKYTEAAIIALLVIFNAVMSTLQENKAQNALELLKQRLTVTTRVLRDGTWQVLPGTELVPGDVVHVRMGDLVPADLVLQQGQIALDQSSLTGESLSVDAGRGNPAYAGTTVVRGEATGQVRETGIRTRFGKTAELVRLAKTTGQLEKIVFAIIKYLVILDAILVTIVFADALLTRLALGNLLPFALILLVASVPVALPATFTVATALGSIELARNGVLVTRLSAIEEAASMQVLCTDKTGTLTENRLSVAGVTAFGANSQEDVLRLAVMASDEATQDPLDKAILEKAASEKIFEKISSTRKEFIPFDPATKRSEAVYEENGKSIKVMKGAAQVIGALDAQLDAGYSQAVESLASQGYRVLAVASETDGVTRVNGLVAFQDPPRADSAGLIARIKELGIRIVMITGDSLITAEAVAAKIGIGSRACHADDIAKQDLGHIEACDVYAEVLPEQKYQLVQKYQKASFTVGMTGDGVNDAPALKQAEVGVAVSSATDVAKAAASLVLTSPGLSNLVSAIETSRQIYQRMLTYTLNKIIKTIEIAFFLSMGLILFKTFVTTPLLMVLLLFTNDFVTMSISTDQVRLSPKPNIWKVRSIVTGAIFLAIPILALSFSIFLYAQKVLQLPLANLQTLLFVMLVFSGQGTIYLVRERRHFWRSLPSKWMLIGSVADILVVSALANFGILMAPIPPILIAELLGVIAFYLFFLDFLKVAVFSHIRLN